MNEYQSIHNKRGILQVKLTNQKGKKRREKKKDITQKYKHE